MLNNENAPPKEGLYLYMNIKVKVHEPVCLPVVLKKGDWVDLKAAEDVNMTQGSFGMINLGISMALPEGYEAIIAPRSSTFKNWGIIQTNSFGVIDNSYSSDKDIWKMPVYGTTPASIKKGDRVCQFRIQLSQKATVWQKIKWLFTGKIWFIETDTLPNTSERGGFGSTGKN